MAGKMQNRIIVPDECFFNYNLYKGEVIEQKTDVYRRTTIGTTLLDALKELEEANKIPPSLSTLVTHQFDRSIARKLQYVPNHVVFKPKRIVSYSGVSETWKFKFKNVIVSDTEYEIGEFDEIVVHAAKPQPVAM